MKYKNTTIRKIIATLFLTVLLLAGTTHVMNVEVAHAQSAADAGPADAAPQVDSAAPAGSGTVGALLGAGNSKNSVIISALAEILALVLRMISQLLWPLLMLAGGLMKSDFLYTGAIDLKLSELWIQVRNLVNIAYVLMLLAVALYNVIGLGEMVSVLELKKALPKIMLGLVLVNFSYAGVKVVLDIVNVGTTFAFAVGRTDAQLTASTKVDVAKSQEAICKVMSDQSSAAAAMASGAQATADAGKPPVKPVAPVKVDDAAKKNQADAQASLGQICDSSGKFTKSALKYIQGWGVDGALVTIAVKFMKIQDLGQVTTQMAGSGGLNTLTIGMLFSVVMYLIYGVSFTVLVVVLFARAAMLWMVIVFSPFVVFNLTFPNLIPSGDMGKKITDTLLAPIKIGFILSIGFILLSTMQQVTGSPMIGAPTTSIDTFQGLIVAIGSVVFIWMGINSAVSGTVGAAISEGIMTSAKDAGTWLAKAPFKYAPMFQVKTPHGAHGEMMTGGQMLGYDQVGTAIAQLMSTHDTERRNDALRKTGQMEVIVELKDVKSIGELTNTIKDHANPQKLWDKTSQDYKDLKTGVKKAYENNTVLAGKDVDFMKLYNAVVNNAGSESDVRDSVEKFRKRDKVDVLGAGPAAGPATPATGSTKTPEDIGDAQVKKSEMGAVKVSLDGGVAPDATKLGKAIAEFNKELSKDGKLVSDDDRAAAIVEFMKKNIVGFNTAKMKTFTDTLKTPAAVKELNKSMPTTDVPLLQNALEKIVV